MSQICRRPCRGCGLKCFSVSRTQRCPPTLTLLPFQPSAVKHVGCFQLHLNRNCNIIIYLFIVEGGHFLFGRGEIRSEVSGWEVGCRTSALEELCILLTDLSHQIGGGEQELSCRRHSIPSCAFKRLT